MILLVGTFLLMWLMMQGIVKPVRMLTAAAKRVASGDFKAAIPGKRQDEIGQLSGAFYTMTQELAKSRDELVLRNEELSALNSIAVTVSQSLVLEDVLQNAMLKIIEVTRTTAVLQGGEGKPIGGATVKFFVKADFFARGLMEIGEAITNVQGTARFEYTPRQTGDIQIIARYGDNGFSTIETTTVINLMESNEPFYEAEAGIRLPAPGAEVFIGPQSALELGEWGKAPASAFYLPGGILSWLLLLVVTVMLIWFTYFRVMYQAFRIPIVSEIRDTDTRLVPFIGLVIVVALGTLLVLMLLTGPYSHLHLLR